LIASLVAGMSARIIMRIVALTAHQPPGFSIAGTLRIVGIGFILGMIAGFVYAPTIAALSASPKIRKYLPGPIWRGLTFAVLILAICGLLSLLLPLLPPEDIGLGIPLLNKIMFAALPLIFGITLGGAEKILDRYLPRKAVSTKAEAPGPQPHEE
jgi:uncharacterized membrane protein